MCVHTLFKKYLSCDTTITVFSKSIKKSCNQLILFKSKSFVGSSSNNTSGFPNKLCANRTFTLSFASISFISL